MAVAMIYPTPEKRGRAKDAQRGKAAESAGFDCIRQFKAA
jgi:hypothetical protein